MQKQYDSLDTYINLAKKTISKFGPKFYNGLSTEMLKNNVLQFVKFVREIDSPFVNGYVL